LADGRGRGRRTAPYLFCPEKKFSHSGESFYYLQRVIKTLTNKPLDVLAESSLFRPLGLSHISFSWNSQMAPFQSSGHDTSGHPLTKTRYVHPNAAYTLSTSAEDYARLICSLLGLNRAGVHSLSKGSVREMTSHHVRVDIREPIKRPGEALGLGVDWGLGWAIDSTMSVNIE